jgi:hypothetical protein
MGDVRMDQIDLVGHMTAGRTVVISTGWLWLDEFDLVGFVIGSF